MAQGQGLPKPRASFYGYNTKPAAMSSGVKKPKNPGGHVGSQIIETQRPEYQGVKMKSGK